jgi:hypothetical protein
MAADITVLGKGIRTSKLLAAETTVFCVEPSKYAPRLALAAEKYWLFGGQTSKRAAP